MRQKEWYRVFVDGKELAKVRSKGLAYIVAGKFREIYTTQKVEVK